MHNWFSCDATWRANFAIFHCLSGTNKHVEPKLQEILSNFVFHLKYHLFPFHRRYTRHFSIFQILIKYIFFRTSPYAASSLASWPYVGVFWCSFKEDKIVQFSHFDSQRYISTSTNRKFSFFTQITRSNNFKVAGVRAQEWTEEIKRANYSWNLVVRKIISNIRLFTWETWWIEKEIRPLQRGHLRGNWDIYTIAKNSFVAFVEIMRKYWRYLKGNGLNLLSSSRERKYR